MGEGGIGEAAGEEEEESVEDRGECGGEENGEGSGAEVHGMGVRMWVAGKEKQPADVGVTLGVFGDYVKRKGEGQGIDWLIQALSVAGLSA